MNAGRPRGKHPRAYEPGVECPKPADDIFRLDISPPPRNQRVRSDELPLFRTASTVFPVVVSSSAVAAVAAATEALPAFGTPPRNNAPRSQYTPPSAPGRL